jgi:GNAT superfamily N-acetyltransferase
MVDGAPTGAVNEPAVGSVDIRRPTEQDHAAIVDVVDEWWSGRRVRHRLPRMWFRHFAGSAWIAETADGRRAGVVIGFVSPGRPDEAVLHLLGVDPNLRRRGLGSALEARLADDARRAGAHRIVTTIPTGDPAALAFLVARGYRIDDGPGTRSIHGTPAMPDYDGPGEDRVLLSRVLGPA